MCRERFVTSGVNVYPYPPMTHESRVLKGSRKMQWAELSTVSMKTEQTNRHLAETGDAVRTSFMLAALSDMRFLDVQWTGVPCGTKWRPYSFTHRERDFAEEPGGE